MTANVNPIVPLAAGLSAALGTTVIIGWWTHNITLLTIEPRFVAMAFNTAIGFLLSGASLLLLAFRKLLISRICIFIVGSIGLLTLLEYLFRCQLGIDQLFMREYIRAGIENPTRMAVATAFCFTCTAAALTVYSQSLTPRSNRVESTPESDAGSSFLKRSPAVVALGAVVFGLGTVALSGYFSGVTAYYAWGKLTRMAVHTAIGFQILGIGIICLEWISCDRVRRTLSTVSATAGVTATLCLWQAIVVAQGVQESWISVAQRAFPPPRTLVNLESHLAAISLLVGLGLTVLLTTAVHLAVNAREREQEVLRANEAKARFAAIVDSSSHAMMSYDLDGVLLSWNMAAARLACALECGGRAEVGSFFRSLGPGIVENALERVRRGGAAEEAEVYVTNADGISRFLAVVTAPVCSGAGQVIGLSLIAYDVTSQKRIEQDVRDYAVVLEYQKRELETTNYQLNALAKVDGLTGLYNRRAFQERIANDFLRARSEMFPISVAMLDVDKFKDYNDAYGHLAGDDVLRCVGQLIQKNVRSTDFAARYGGEEFVVVLRMSGPDAIAAVERIRHAVEASAWLNRPVTVSCGVSTHGESVESVEALIHRADSALYASKHSGRNTVTHIDDCPAVRPEC